MATVLFVAGDLSGDGHAALLAAKLGREHPGWNLAAVGGNSLRATGARMVADTSDCGVIGMVPAVMLIPRLKRTLKNILAYLEEVTPDLAVLCDWGAFNVRLIPYLKERGVPVLYYFPPASWRQTGTRGLGIAKLGARIATPFSWSADRLRAAGGEAEWVGHPLLEIARAARPRAELRREFGASESTRLIALLPGSRRLELKYIAPAVLGAARKLEADMPQEKWKFAAAAPLAAADRTRAALGGDIEVVEAKSFELLLACDAAVVKSGTSTLEAAVAGAPQTVVYDGSPVMRAQWRLISGSKNHPFIAMPNIILGRMAVRELLQNDCRPETIATELKSLLFDEARRDTVKEAYREVRVALGEELLLGATARTAQIVEELVSHHG